MMAMILPGVIFMLIVAVLSARWNWWRPVRPGVPILMYHKVGNPPEGSRMPKLWVSVDQFRRQMEHLKKKGYTPIVFRDLYRHWEKGTELPAKPVLITFDDGYQNNFTHAAPILKEFAYPATLFVVTSAVGRDNYWHDPKSEIRIEMVTWDELRKLHNAGWEIGSHTINHPRLARIAPEQAFREIADSRRMIKEAMGSLPDTLAYPYGDGADDESIRAMAGKAGYQLAVSIHSGKWTLDQFRVNPHCLPRIFVAGDETMFDFHLQLTRGRSRL